MAIVETTTTKKTLPTLSPASVSDQKKKSVKPMVKEITVTGSFLRVGPRKARLVVDRIKGKSVDQALHELRFINRAAVEPLYKLLLSGVANAEHNFRYHKDDLFVKSITVDGGPFLKRYSPRAHGRSAVIRKKTSHIHVILGVREGAKQLTAKRPTADTAPAEVKVVAPQEVKKQLEGIGAPTADQTETGQKKSGFLKKVFSRKTG